MNFFGPERKYIVNGTRPMLNVGNSVLPNMSILPTSANMFRLSLMLPVRSNACSWHEHDCTIAEIPSILQRYLDDPEELFASVFGWNGQGFSAMDMGESAAEKLASAGAPRRYTAPVQTFATADDIDTGDVF